MIFDYPLALHIKKNEQATCRNTYLQCASPFAFKDLWETNMQFGHGTALGLSYPYCQTEKLALVPLATNCSADFIFPEQASQ